LAEFKKTLEGAAVPSLVTLLLALSATTISYGYGFGAAAELVFGAATGIVALAFAFAMLRDSCHRGKGPSGMARAAFLSLLVPICIAAVPAYRISAIMAADAADPGSGPVLATVTSVRMLRYSLETDLSWRSTGSSDMVKIRAYFPTGTEIGEGDEIKLSRRPRALAGKNASSQFARGLLRKGITHTVSPGTGEFEVTGRAAPTKRRQFQQRLAERIGRLFDPGTSALLKGLYFGNANHIGKDTVYHFTRSGVLHILSASGSHLTTLAFLPVALLGLFRVDRRAIFVLVAAVLAAYIFITDLPVSLQRAFIMFCVGGICLLLDYERNALNALFHSAAAIVVMQPWEIYSLGSQLTFGATLGILLFYGGYRDSLAKLPALLRNPLALTLSAQSLIFPVLAFRLGEINIISLAANLVVVPLVELVFTGSVCILLLDTASPAAAHALAAFLDICHAAGVRSAVFFSSLPGHFSPGSLAPALVVPYILYLAPLLKITRGRPPAALCLPAACAAAWVILAPIPMRPGEIAVLKTPHTRAAFTLMDGVAHIAGKVGSVEDAKLLAREVRNTGAGKVSLRLAGIEFGSIGAASHLAKNLNLAAFTIEGNFIYGKYLDGLLSVLDRDGVRLFMEGGSPAAAPETKKSDAFARERAASLLQKAITAAAGTGRTAGGPPRMVRFDTTEGPGGD